jgi:ketosteroid isomerase-like protein
MGSATATDNLTTVRNIYAAFGRGDVPAILETLADEVRWEEWGDSFAQRAGVPWLEARSGPDGAGAFFGMVGTFDVKDFQVLDIIGGDRQVGVEVFIDAQTPGGGRLRDEEFHLWTFNDEGKVVRMRHYTDTAKHIAAAGGEDTTTR